MDIGNEDRKAITALQDAMVDDITGRPVKLGELWQSRAVVFVFVRHFG